MLALLVISVVIAISANGVAMAANGIGHQVHCLDANGETAHKASLEHAHDYSSTINRHALPFHDHETCMMHTCPALSVDTVKLSELSDTFLAKLSWPELPQHFFERSDSLKRPPKS